MRRRILELLAGGKPHTTSGAARHVSRRLDASLKHLIALREAGVVTTQPNPSIPAASSTPWLHIPVRRPESGRVEMDFDCCLLRL